MSRIDPADLRPGDRYRVTDVHEGVVTRNDFAGVRDTSQVPVSHSVGPHWTRTFELLDRPMPEPEGDVLVKNRDGVIIQRVWGAWVGSGESPKPWAWWVKYGAPLTIYRAEAVLGK